MSKHVLGIALAAVLLAAIPISSAWTQDKQTPAAAPAKPAKVQKMSPGRAAAIERQKKCGAEWKSAKAAGKIEKAKTWPKFWSACNKRLKATSG